VPTRGPRAKVFLSCGQQRNTDEVEIARRIAQRLQQLGYDTYIAVEEQSLRGVKENIFAQLETSEYFVFIDFRREPLAVGSGTCHRGSLFSHQELAIASHLEIPLLAFQERGVKREDGLMRFLQANATEFGDRDLLPNVVADRVQELGWCPDWKRALRLHREPDEHSDAVRHPDGKHARYFHIQVQNLHPSMAALNCYAYLEAVRNGSSQTDIPIQTVEFKWAGYILPNALVGPGSSRRFDAFWVFHERPDRPQFNVFADATNYIPQLRGPGNYHLIYSVISENFPVCRRAFVLRIGSELADIQFEAVADA